MAFQQAVVNDTMTHWSVSTSASESGKLDSLDADLHISSQRTWGLLSSHDFFAYDRHKNKAIPEPVLVAGWISTWRIWMIGACNSWCSSLNPWLPERKPMRESCRMPFGGEIIEGIIVTRTAKSQFFFEPATKTHYGFANFLLIWDFGQHNYPLAIQEKVIEYGWGNGNFLSVYK